MDMVRVRMNGHGKDMASSDHTQQATQSGGPTLPSLGRATPSRATSPVDSRVTVVMASQQTLQAMARAAMVLLTDKLRIQAMALSQLPNVTAPLVAMVVARVSCHLTGSRPLLLAVVSSQLPAAPWEVMVAVLRAAAMGSPREGAMANNLAVVDSKPAKDSSKAPIIPLRAMDNRASTTVVMEVVQVIMAKTSAL